MTWKDIKHFTPKEFDSPDEPGSGLNMDLDFVARLDNIREECEFPFVIHSGYRSKAHNKAVDGVSASAHTKGLAVDIEAPNGAKKFAIVEIALLHGITRIGVGDSFVHLDASKTLPQNVLWTY